MQTCKQIHRMHVMQFDLNTRSPRQMVFLKMEEVLRAMQHPKNGIPIRPQKIFLTSVPCAFTGLDMIEWLVKNLNIEEYFEALHLSNLFCHYGYVFPIQDSKNLVVKDDSTHLYRFQSPYFWPSNNSEPDDFEYAIYLAKRTMRNKQKHGLEVFELTALSRLRQNLRHKWEFIYLQAEEQIRLIKQRKKVDKIILDSQERAFWRVHKPPPGQTSSLEQGIRKSCSVYSKPSSQQKDRLEEVQKEIELLKSLLAKPRCKMSNSLQGLFSHCQVYAEHDPLIAGAQPSNPWITEDTTMWDLNAVLVDVPTERRVRRWAISLKELLSDATGRHEFEKFLQKEYSQENIRFWQACENLKVAPQSKVASVVKEIYDLYLAPEAPCEINVDSKTMEKTQKALQKPSRFTFEAAQSHIFILMKKDSFQRFLKSEMYKGLLKNSLQISSKRKFFSFAGKLKATKIITPNASPLLLRKKENHRGSNEAAAQDTHEMMAKLSEDSKCGVYEGRESSSSTTPSSSPTINGNESRKSINVSTTLTSSGQSHRKSSSLGGGGGEGTVLSLEVPKQYPVNSPDNNSTSQASKTFTYPVPQKKSAVTPWDNGGGRPA